MAGDFLLSKFINRHDDLHEQENLFTKLRHFSLCSWVIVHYQPGAKAKPISKN